VMAVVVGGGNRVRSVGERESGGFRAGF